MTPVFIFLSYNHKDEQYKEQLLNQLRVLERHNSIQTWTTSQIRAGQDREQEIKKAMAKARIAIILVTSNYLKDDVSYHNEFLELLKRYEEERLILFPIIGRHCPWKQDKNLNHLHVWLRKSEPVWSVSGNDLEKALSEICDEILSLVDELSDVDNLSGSILTLLNLGLDTEPMVEDVADLYYFAESEVDLDYEKAIEICNQGLNFLEKGPPGDIVELDALPYTRGKFHLLFASIQLEKINNFSLAERHFRESKNQFSSRKWFHLEALAYLGLGMTQRIAGNYREAVNNLHRAENSLRQDNPDKVDEKGISALTDTIRKEILKVREENLEISKLSLPYKSEKPQLPKEDAESLAKYSAETESIPGPQDKKFSSQEETMGTSQQQTESSGEEMKRPVEPLDPNEKIVPIFNASTGKGLVTTREIADLNLLACEDYEQELTHDPEKVVFDSKKHKDIKNADYVLEIDENIVSHDGLEVGDWLLIRVESELQQLKGRRVAVLIEDQDKTSIFLRTFIKAKDHYLFKAENPQDTSFIVVNYNITLGRMRAFDALYYGKKIVRRVDDIQVSGAIINKRRVPKKSIRDRAKAFIWRLPVLNQIAAGADAPPREDNIRSYVEHRDLERRGDDNYFVVEVKGDSMSQDGIKSGNLVLIRQQEDFNNGDIVAAIIETPNDGRIGTLKRCYLHTKGSSHWFLKASNPEAESLVVIPRGSNAERIRAMYSKAGKANVRFYENSTLSIAGKYIKKVTS